MVAGKTEGKAARVKSTTRIDDQCRAFALHVEKAGISNPDKQTMMKFFSKTDMQALWKRFETARGREGMSVQDAWNDLLKLGKAKSEAKRYETLASFVGSSDPREWCNRLITVTEEIRHRKEDGSKSKILYMGELEQLHGEREAADFVRRGKYKEVLDEWGDAAYAKLQRVSKYMQSRSSTCATSRPAV